MQNILVTGGAGFIGSHLCEALLQNGNRVIIVDNFNDYYNPDYKRENASFVEQTARQMNNSSLKIFEADICNRIQIGKIFTENKIDTVVHLAAYAGVRPSIENAPLYAEVNLDGTLNILECMKNHDIKKLVFASSSSVYGNNEKVPFSEKDIVDFPISPYAATKKSGEILCYTYHHLYNINVACLRFFTVFGPRQRPDLAIYKFTDLVFKEQPIPFYGDGSMRRDYTFITDTLDGILKAVSWVQSDEGKYDIFNLGESRTISLTEMVGEIGKAAGKEPVLDRQPAPPGDMKITFADIEKARRVLGYDPKTDFQSGIEIFVKWFKENRR